MTLEEKIKILENEGCIRITSETLKQIEKANKDLYNSVTDVIYIRKARGREYKLIYINNKTFMIYSKEYIEKNDINRIKKNLKLWIKISKAKI